MQINKIFNRDCIEFMKEMADKSVDLVLTDIPYEVCSGRNEGGLRSINKGAADVATFKLSTFLDNCARICRGPIYVFCGTEQVSEIREWLQFLGMTTRCCVWEKTNPSPMNGEHLWLSSVELCVFGRFSEATFNRFCESPVWRFPSGSSKRHPTEKPRPLFKHLVEASSKPGDLVFDPCMGSGTTAEAAITTGRNFIGTEINPEFLRIANQRLRDLTGPFSLYGDIGT